MNNMNYFKVLLTDITVQILDHFSVVSKKNENQEKYRDIMQDSLLFF